MGEIMILETIALLPIGEKPIEAETAIDTRNIVVLFKQPNGAAGVIMLNGLVVALRHSYADLLAILHDEDDEVEA